MGSTNIGNQIIYIQHDGSASSSNICKQFKDIIEEGIISGGELTHLSGNTINLAPCVVTFRCSTGELIKLETSENIEIEVSEENPYIIGNFTWVNTLNNYADFLSKSFEDLYENDVIFGKAVYETGSITSISFEEKTIFDKTTSIVNIENIKTKQTEKVIKGITEASDTTTIIHNLDANKILKINAFIIDGSDKRISPNSNILNNEFNISFDNTNILLENVGSNLQEKDYKIYLTIAV